MSTKKRSLQDAGISSEDHLSKRAKNNHNPQIASLDTDECGHSESEHKDENQPIDYEKVISIQVGERTFHTKIGTLTQYDNHNYFGKLFSGHYSVDNIFIDRNGDTFSHILEFLRSKHLILGNKVDKEALLERILIEAKFYGIDTLSSFIEDEKRTPLPGSSILTVAEQRNINKILWNTFSDEDEFWEQVPITDNDLETHSQHIRGDVFSTLILIEDTESNVFAIRSNIGICQFEELHGDRNAQRFGLLDPNTQNRRRQLLAEQKFIFYHIRDSKNQVSMNVLGCGNYLITDVSINDETVHILAKDAGNYSLTPSNEILILKKGIEDLSYRVETFPQSRSDEIKHVPFV
eukprot:617153_1